jgi:hypothetical protein
MEEGDMMSKKRLMMLPALALTALLGTGLAAADGMTTAYVVHGINGDDFPALELDPALPVDVFVSDLGCALTEFKFGDRVGPLVVPAGSYDITVSLADVDNPCEGAAVIALTGVPLAEGANGTIIAHRTYDGSPGAGDQLGLGITASLFDNDFTSTGRGMARILAHHTALAPSVDVVVSRDYWDMGAPSVMVPGFTNPTAPGDAILSQINAEFRPGEWDIALELGGTNVFGPDMVELKPFTTTYVYAVGDFAGGTFQYLVYTEGGLKEKRDRGRSAEGSSRRGR